MITVVWKKNKIQMFQKKEVKERSIHVNVAGSMATLPTSRKSPMSWMRLLRMMHLNLYRSLGFFYQVHPGLLYRHNPGCPGLPHQRKPCRPGLPCRHNPGRLSLPRRYNPPIRLPHWHNRGLLHRHNPTRPGLPYLHNFGRTALPFRMNQAIQACFVGTTQVTSLPRRHSS